jgi:osmotically-inducible protein OsmY
MADKSDRSRWAMSHCRTAWVNNAQLSFHLSTGQGAGNMTTPDLARTDPDRLAPGGCRIRLSVEHRLQRSGYAALNTVCVEFQGESGILHLRGSVPSYYLKQVAQELVVDVDGVRYVNNQIIVARSSRNGTVWDRDGAEPSAS